MVRVLKQALMLCLVLGLTTIAFGQQERQPPRPDPLGPILSNPDVQRELKLSEDQVGKLKNSLGKVMEKYQDKFAKLQQLSPEEQQKTFKSLNEDSHKAIAGVLDDKQTKRFKQIQWQLSGINALQDPDLQKDLKLSDDQRKKLDGIFSDAGKKMQDMIQRREQSREKYEALAKDVEDRANGVLTDEQKKSFKEMMGSRFEMRQPRRGQ
jgi:hypothetical protein